jgi:mono/diheme cytochrome c family protein
MKLPLEMKALGWAVVAVSVSLGGALLMASPIQILSSSSPAAMTSATPNSSLKIAASPELVGQGHEFFEMSCSQCHGDDAHGDEGPDLHNLAISNARIATTIKKGIKGEMPTFAKKYDDRQVAALVSYLRSLR